MRALKSAEQTALASGSALLKSSEPHALPGLQVDWQEHADESERRSTSMESTHQVGLASAPWADMIHISCLEVHRGENDAENLGSWAVVT